MQSLYRGGLLELVTKQGFYSSMHEYEDLTIFGFYSTVFNCLLMT